MTEFKKNQHICMAFRWCPECNLKWCNVFIDPRPQIRNGLIAAIIGLRKLPKPIILMILARTAVYTGNPIRSFRMPAVFTFNGEFEGDEHNMYRID